MVARFAGDNDWYRAEVLVLKPEGASVSYVDYRNTDTIGFDMIRKARKFCSEVPIQGIACTLHGVEAPADRKWSSAVASIMAELAQKPLKANIKAIVNRVVSVELLTLNNVSANEMINTLLVGTQKPELKSEKSGTGTLAGEMTANKQSVGDVTPVMKSKVSGEEHRQVEETNILEDDEGLTIENAELPLDGSKVEVSVVSVQALDQVYVQLYEEDLLEMLMTVQKELTSKCQENSGFKPREGDYVAAKFTDNVWYRGLVKKQLDAETFSVFFVDYGNTETLNCGLITELNSKYTCLKAMAVRCQLRGSENAEPEVIQDLQCLVNSKFSVRAVNFQDDVYIIDMYLMDGTFVNDVMHFTKSAISPKPYSPAGGKGAEQELHLDGAALLPEPEEPKADTAILSPVLRPEEAISKPKVLGPNDKLEAEVSNETENTITIAERSLPLDDSEVNCLVVYIESLACFFVQTNSEEFRQELIAVQQSVNEMASTDDVVYKPVLGECVSARYTEDGLTMWYRARVLDIQNDKVQVFILDYGNIDWVAGEDIRKLDASLMSSPALAVRCKLNGCTGDEDQALIEDFSAVKNEIVNVKAIKKLADRYLVDLTLPKANYVTVSSILQLTKDDWNNTQDQVKEQGVGVNGVDDSNVSVVTPAAVTHTTPGSKVSEISGIELPVDTIVSAAMFWLESIHSFYIQLAEDQLQMSFLEMMNQFSEVFVQAAEYKPSVGEIVGAYYFDGEQALWYRSEVLTVEEKGCKVFFFDYGNSDFVELKNIRKMDKKFLSHPRMAIHCGLLGCDEEQQEMLDIMKTFLNIEVKVKAHAVENGKYVVEMWTVDGESIRDKLGLKTQEPVAPTYPSTELVDQLPKPATPVSSPLPRRTRSPLREKKSFFTQTLARSGLTGKDLMVVITSIVRPNLFHCQEYKDDHESKLCILHWFLL